MAVPVFYVLNGLLALSGLLALWLRSGEQRFSLSLIQIIAALPLLSGEYLYLAYHLEAPAARVVLFSEMVFALTWLAMAMHLRSATVSGAWKSRISILGEIGVGAVATAGAAFFLSYRLAPEITASMLTFSNASPVYFSSIFLLLIVFYAAWGLEQFWRSLDTRHRREYKTVVVGSFLVCGIFIWSSSYRLTYMAVLPNHLLLLSALLPLGWGLILYGVLRHRLLNRKIFVSRKVVYSFVVPSLLAFYLVGFGLVSLVMRAFGLQMSFVLKWLFLTLGFAAIGLFAFSDKMRRRVHFFISTHFYVNKYEYRDEWLALSQRLQGAIKETDVVEALRLVLEESLYTREIFIWLGDASRGYRLVAAPERFNTAPTGTSLAADDPLVRFLQAHGYFHLHDKEPVPSWHWVAEAKREFLRSLDLVLVFPLSVGNQMAGLIGLGPEFTGGQYGYDDFDLLTALGTQAASALLAVRMAEELAHSREQQAWDRLSAFVLHDIKNAASMLSLLRENAPEHIHEPEFQQDMLEVVDDALKRMGRVEERLRTLKDEITPVFQALELGPFLEDIRRRLENKLLSMEIIIDCKDEIRINTDPKLLFSILENLFLNSFEAQGEQALVRIRAARDDDNGQAIIEVMDNGPGIAEELLPDLLFEPFKTTKDGGSGIGLWQAKRLVTALGGSISAGNRAKRGAWFVLRLPLRPADPAES